MACIYDKGSNTLYEIIHRCTTHPASVFVETLTAMCQDVYSDVSHETAMYISV